MQNNQKQQSQAAISGLQIATSAGNALPPNNFVETLLDGLFQDWESDTYVLAPFDYEAFLRREVLV